MATMPAMVAVRRPKAARRPNTAQTTAVPANATPAATVAAARASREAGKAGKHVDNSNTGEGGGRHRAA